MAINGATMLRLNRKRNPQTNEVQSVFMAVRTQDDTLEGGAYFEYWLTGDELAALSAMTLPNGDPDLAAQQAAVKNIMLTMAPEKHQAWLDAKAAEPINEEYTSADIEAQWGTASITAEDLNK